LLPKQNPYSSLTSISVLSHSTLMSTLESPTK